MKSTLSGLRLSGTRILLYASVLFLPGVLFLPVGGEAVAVRDYDGDLVLREALPESGKFGVKYRHSYYRAPAVEHFAAEPSGFRLLGLSSTSHAVLDYYELEGNRIKRGEWIYLEPESGRSYESLPFIATRKGRRTLVVSGRETPLYKGDTSRHLRLEVERSPMDRLLGSLGLN